MDTRQFSLYGEQRPLRLANEFADNKFHRFIGDAPPAFADALIPSEMDFSAKLLRLRNFQPRRSRA